LLLRTREIPTDFFEAVIAEQTARAHVFRKWAGYQSLPISHAFIWVWHLRPCAQCSIRVDTFYILTLSKAFIFVKLLSSSFIFMTVPPSSTHRYLRALISTPALHSLNFSDQMLKTRNPRRFSRAQRNTNTGIREWVSTFWVSLPSSRPFMPL
jgi:hypothetical protein